MKIARLTSLLLNAPRQSSQRPRLRHGRRLAIYYHPNLTLNLYTLFFSLSLALLPRAPPLVTSLTVFSHGIGYAAYLRFPSSVSQPKALCSRTRGFFSELRRATFPEESHLSSALLSPPLNFLRLPPAFPHPLPLAQTKLPILC